MGAAVSESTFWFPCKQCHRQEGVLIGGVCSKCGPDIHAEWQARANAHDALAERYYAETGIKPLANWNAFEDWCAAQ